MNNPTGIGPAGHVGAIPTGIIRGSTGGTVPSAHQQEKHNRPQWEYKREISEDIDYLNELGKDGWELVCVVQKTNYFKRIRSIDK